MTAASLPNGTYETDHGSTVTISGVHGGIARVSFDWFEEPNACCDCSVEPYPELQDDGTHHLTWRCGYCGGGSAALHPAGATQ